MCDIFIPYTKSSVHVEFIYINGIQFIFQIIIDQSVDDCHTIILFYNKNTKTYKNIDQTLFEKLCEYFMYFFFFIYNILTFINQMLQCIFI